jgi:hypothetical protein
LNRSKAKTFLNRLETGRNRPFSSFYPTVPVWRCRMSQMTHDELMAWAFERVLEQHAEALAALADL